jgi:hypothetical protein
MDDHAIAPGVLRVVQSAVSALDQGLDAAPLQLSAHTPMLIVQGISSRDNPSMRRQNASARLHTRRRSMA